MTTLQHDAIDLLMHVAGPQPKSPAKTWLYDYSDSVYRVELQNKYNAGSLDSQNPLFTTTYNYDNGNRLTAETVEIDATTTATTQLLYTAGGRLSRVTDPNGNATAFEYDERGLIFKVTEGYGSPVAGTHTWNYDLNGNPASIVNPKNNSTAFQFDHSDRPVRIAAGRKKLADAIGGVFDVQAQCGSEDVERAWLKLADGGVELFLINWGDEARTVRVQLPGAAEARVRHLGHFH